jgi:hypothetical protein
MAIIALIAVVFLALFAVMALTFVGGSSVFLFSGGAAILCIPILVVIVVGIILVAQGAIRRSIPPPPPIQQPMVPAGQQGPIALSCPNCGGPPTNVDRFGIATCSYCGTRFLVR